MLLILAIVLVSLFFTVNIGASGAATSMGIAYSAKAVSNKTGVGLCAGGLFLGSWFGGGTVVKTLSQGIVPESDMTLKITLMILIAATSTLFFANLLGIPLSTSEVTVGAIVGLGMVTHHLFIGKLVKILLFWIVMPGASFFLAWGLRHALNRLNLYEKRKNKWLTFLIVSLGVIEAYAAGMNNVANSMGPLVGSHLISVNHAVLIGGVLLSLGALTLGRATLETNGTQIVSLTLIEGGGFLEWFPSLLFLPPFWVFQCQWRRSRPALFWGLRRDRRASDFIRKQ